MVDFAELTAADYAEAHALWKRADGIGLSSADGREAVERYLLRNPGLSSVARVRGKLVATVLCGHDGRRGYLHHLVVEADSRRRGIGCALVERSLRLLAGEGIEKCHVFLLAENASGRAFWEALGFQWRRDIGVCSRSSALTA